MDFKAATDALEGRCSPGEVSAALDVSPIAVRRAPMDAGDPNSRSAPEGSSRCSPSMRGAAAGSW